VGRIGDPHAMRAVVRALSSPFPALRREAAQAAILLMQAEERPAPPELDVLQRTLGAAEEAETDVRTRQLMLRALGTLATPEALGRLSERLVGPGELRSEAAVGLGLAARKGLTLPPEALQPLVALSTSPDETQRRAATFALAQTGRPELMTALRERAQDLDAETRAWAVVGLGKSVAPHDAGRLGNMAVRERDFRVRAELARALAAHARRCTPDNGCPALLSLQELLEPLSGLRGGSLGQDVWPFQALSLEELPLTAREMWTRLRERLKTTAEERPPLQRVAGQLDCRAAAALDRLDGALRESLSCGLDAVPQGERYRQGLEAVIQSSRFRRATSAGPVLALLARPEAAVRALAARGLGKLGAPQAIRPLRARLADPQLPVALAAAEALAQLGVRDIAPELRPLVHKVEQTPALATRLADALVGLGAVDVAPELKGWLSAAHPHLRHEARRVLSALGLPIPDVPIAEAVTDGRFPAPGNPVPSTRLVLVTEAGDITLQLEPEAPLGAAQLKALVEKGFYDGLIFEQVEPRLWVQGGDPLGGAGGGPGSTVPSEPWPSPWEDGWMGFTLSGADTAGSRFFIGTGWAPQLQGTFTVVAEVVDGLEVLRALLPGTRLERARLEPTPGS
jgi:cyclophilin family peptidyl-prolyl cis-trans isomerase/HEAT repeat protein